KGILRLRSGCGLATFVLSFRFCLRDTLALSFKHHLALELNHRGKHVTGDLLLLGCPIRQAQMDNAYEGANCVGLKPQFCRVGDLTQMSKWTTRLDSRAWRTRVDSLPWLICGGFDMRNSDGGTGLAREERLQIMLSPKELEAVDNFRFLHRMPSRAAAVR